MESMHLIFIVPQACPPLFVSRIVLTSYLAEGVGAKDSVLR